MRYYIIAGEASGDLHASNLIRAIRKEDPSSQFRCWGGNLMKQAGGALVKHYRDLAYMGFMEVVTHLPVILSNLRFCKQDILQYHPDVVILVDYPGFNLRIAKYARSIGLKVFYYISPQLWAWKSGRVKILKTNVERMFVILPFEKDFYAQYHYYVDFVGHPLLDVLNDSLELADRNTFLKQNNLDNRPIIAALPGSRTMEVAKMLKIMLRMVPLFPTYQIVIAEAPSLATGFYASLIKDHSVGFVRDQTYALLKHSVAAMVTSGTATLETALMNVPQVVCYRGNPISYLIARQLVHVRYISLVNLIMDAPLVQELLQNDLNSRNLYEALSLLLTSESSDRIRSGYHVLRSKLGWECASERTAKLMVQYLTKNQV